MGVTCVCQMPLSDGKSVQQTISILHKKLEQLGAVKQEDLLWTETYHATGNARGQPTKFLYVMHNSETTLSCLLKSHFQNAKGHKVESRGSHHRYYDFLIKVGASHLLSAPCILGLFIFVVVPRDMYCNCMVPGDCWNLMKEFMQSFLCPSIVELPSVFATMPGGLYVPAYCVNTMTQYLKMFSKVCKQQVLPGTTLWVKY
uniref:Mediator of RNA polymerase II transcription subunit 20 n=1 Tax=Oncorhynchus kisutch TaxID=8019 RepID=A0A8C7GTT1_ONCKI